MIWSQALRRADPLPFSIHRARHAQKRSSAFVSASMPAACYRIILPVLLTCAPTTRGKRKAQQIRSCAVLDRLERYPPAATS
jgi:hypothetical protein